MIKMKNVDIYGLLMGNYVSSHTDELSLHSISAEYL